MAILLPVLHTISMLMKDKVNFEDVKMWEIQTPSENSLTWAILMSYIFSPSSSANRQQLYEQLLQVLESGNERDKQPDGLEKNLKIVSKTLFRFNPFRNRRFSFYKINFIEALFSYFSKILYKCSGKCNDELRLQDVSNSLRCCIDIYEIESGEKIHSFYHPEDDLVHESDGSFRELILFKRHNSSLVTYGFGLSSRDAVPLRIGTLRFVIKETKLPIIILPHLENVISTGEYDDNFLAGVLRTCKDTMYYLYKSLYVVQKLSEYGFNVDPKKTDSRGLSSFYYCISMHDILALRQLYNYATNSIMTPENCTRNPNESILSALKEVRDTLKNDWMKSKGFSPLGDKQDNAKCICRSYLRFNDYQRKIVREVLHIRKETSDRHLQQHQIIISIIDNYCEYFYFGSEPNENSFLNYIKLSAYYDNLDLFTSFMFFDNLVSLQHLVNENNIHMYVNATRSLFLFILSNKYFSKNQLDFMPNSLEELYGNSEIMYRFLPFSYRTEFKEHAMILSAELTKTITTNQLTKSDVKGVDLIKKIIAYLPEIENEFFSRKLQNYFTIATIVDSPISIFCLERIIQVLGEIICACNITGSIFKHVLQSCLPEGVEKSLCDLRNHCFSHYRENTVQGRLNLERKKRKLLTRLLNEMRGLCFILEPTTKNYFLRLEEFLVKKGKEKSRDEYIEIFQYFHQIQESALLFREKYFIANKRDYAIVSNNLLQFIYEHLSENGLKNLSESLKLSNEEPLTLNQLDTYFRAFIYFTEYISECQKNSELYPYFIDCCKMLNTVIDTHRSKPIYEVKNTILDTLNHLEQIYHKSFDNFDNLNRYEVLSWSRDTLNLFIHKYILFSSGNDKGLQEFLITTSTIFKFDEFEIEKIIKRSENLVNLIKTYEPYLHEFRMKLLECLKLLLKEKFPQKSNENDPELKFTSLKNLTKELKDFNIFSANEKIQLKQHISDLLFESNRKCKEAWNIFEALSNIKNAYLAEEEFDELLKDVVLPQKLKKSISEYIFKSEFKSASTFLQSVVALRVNDIEDKLELNVTKTLMELFKEEKYRTIFLKMDLQPQIALKVYNIMNQKIYFLINRINKLERILINSQENVKYLWENSENGALKQHIKILMCQRFLNERETRASLEMLLFDCLNILKDKKLQELWEKTTNLFSGINLRDFLSHGSPVVELIGGFLDPEDLPMEFIEKILQLISDKTVLISLSKLWVLVKPCTGEELKIILESDAEDKYTNLRKEIKSCSRWTNYFKLLPLEI